MFAPSGKVVVVGVNSAVSLNCDMEKLLKNFGNLDNIGASKVIIMLLAFFSSVAAFDTTLRANRSRSRNSPLREQFSNPLA